MIRVARVVKAVPAPERSEEAEPDTRRVSRFELDARERAQSILSDAEAQAKRIVDAAHEAAKSATEAAAAEAREHEAAKLAAHWVAMKLEEDGRLARETERLVQLAIVLAERLVGDELATNPLQIQKLAENAIAEARGAGSLTLEAHPEDAETLRRLVRELRSFATFTVRETTSLPRGSLLVHTELGTLDARLRPQLERLATHLTALLRA